MQRLPSRALLFAMALLPLLAACGGGNVPYTDASGMFAPPGGNFSVRLPEGCSLADSTIDTMGGGLIGHRYIFRKGLCCAVLVEHAPLPDDLKDTAGTEALMASMAKVFNEQLTVVRTVDTRVAGYPAQTVYFTEEVDGDKAIGRSVLIVARGRIYRLTYLDMDKEATMAELEKGAPLVFFASFHLLKS